MRKFAFYLILLLACVGLASSCSSDDDETDFSGGTELVIGGEEINSITDAYNLVRNIDYPGFDRGDTCIIRCFYSEEEVKNSEEFAPGRRYPEPDVIAELPPIDWDSQTLVLAKFQHGQVVKYKNCKVIKKGDRYLVELYMDYLPCNAFGAAGVFIVVNKPKITEKHFSMKPIAANISDI